MNLTASYRRYLEKPCQPEQISILGSALASHGYGLECELLMAFADGKDRTLVSTGRWANRIAHIGARLPRDANAGEIWLDTRELMPMILLPREFEPGTPKHWRQRLTPFEGWLAMRPVSSWQFAAFLSIANFERVPVQITPPFQLYDAGRILAGPESSPVVNLTCEEAGAYAHWTGKFLCTNSAWESAQNLLEGADIDALWGPRLSEWAGASYFDEGVMVAINEATVSFDPQDEAEKGAPLSPDFRMLFGNWAYSAHIGFRTFVDNQVGLVDEASEAYLSQDTPLRVTSRLSRA